MDRLSVGSLLRVDEREEARRGDCVWDEKGVEWGRNSVRSAMADFMVQVLVFETWFDFVMRGEDTRALTYLPIRKGKEILSMKGKYLDTFNHPQKSPPQAHDE